jgi:hypothetical protein
VSWVVIPRQCSPLMCTPILMSSHLFRPKFSKKRKQRTIKLSSPEMYVRRTEPEPQNPLTDLALVNFSRRPLCKRRKGVNASPILPPTTTAFCPRCQSRIAYHLHLTGFELILSFRHPELYWTELCKNLAPVINVSDSAPWSESPPESFRHVLWSN